MSKPRVVILRDEFNAKFLWNLLRNWKALAAQGKPLAVHVDEHGEQRSGAQNRLYWATLRDIAENARPDGKQFDTNAWHAYFALNMIGSQDLPDGRSAPISTTTLTVAEFADYVTRVQQYAVAELGVELSF